MDKYNTTYMITLNLIKVPILHTNRDITTDKLP